MINIINFLKIKSKNYSKAESYFLSHEFQEGVNNKIILK